MRSRSIRFRMVLTLASLLPALFAVQAVALPGTAEARCADGNVIISHLYVGSFKAVTESPVTSTCNGDNRYHADFRNHYSSGWRTTVWIQNNGNWTVYRGQYHNGWNSYSYTDNNSYSRMTLCVDNGTTVYCGWGSNYKASTHPTFNRTYSGLNSGF